MSSSEFSARMPSGELRFSGPTNLFYPKDLKSLYEEDDQCPLELYSQVQGMEPGLFLLEENAVDPEVMLTASTAECLELPELGLLRDESQHKVFAGQLLVHSLFGDERSDLVAIKPFTLPREAVREYALARYFSGEAGIHHQFRTFTPMGVVRGEDGTYNTITRYEHGVRPLSKVFYNPEHANSDPIIGRALGKAAFLLASLHSQGIKYGDFQLRNAFVSNHREMFVADFESLWPMKRRGKSVHELDAFQSVRANMTTLIQSVLRGREDLSHEKPEYIDMFNLIYLGITNSPSSKVPVESRLSEKEITKIFNDPYANVA